jgi:hypothetical protein
MVTTLAALRVQLDSFGSSKQSKWKFLRDQFHARLSGATPRSYPSIGKEFRSKYGKLKVTSNVGTQCKVEYLENLITAMVVEDRDLIGVNENRLPDCCNKAF